MAKILLVEDNQNLLTFYQRAFRQHTCLSAETAWDAIAILEKQRDFELIILDMHLPEVSGLVVLQHIRKMPDGKDLNVMVVSADDTMRGKAELIGIQHWMTKPIEIDDLLTAADSYLKVSPETPAEDTASPNSAATS